MALPRTCIPCPKIEQDCYDWNERHQWVLGQVRNHKFRIVFVGDSITHFWAGWKTIDHGKKVWDEYYSKLPVLNIGFGFDRTQNVLWRLEHGELEGQSPNLIILNIGTNQFSITPNYSGDSAEDAAAGVLAVVEKLRAMFPKTKLVVMAVFPRGPDTADHYFLSRIGGLNRILKDRLAGRPDTVFLDIGQEFLFPDGSQNQKLYTDGGCHPGPEGYRIWAESLKPFIAEAMKQ